MCATISAFLSVALSVVVVAAKEKTYPNEYLGTVVYFVPKEHADRDYGDHGFIAFVLQQTDENNIKPTFIAHSASEFVTRYQGIPPDLQPYGIWLQLQAGDPYSTDEKATLAELKRLCAKHKLPLSVRTGYDGVWQGVTAPHTKGLTMRWSERLAALVP